MNASGPASGMEANTVHPEAAANTEANSAARMRRSPVRVTAVKTTRATRAVEETVPRTMYAPEEPVPAPVPKEAHTSSAAQETSAARPAARSATRATGRLRAVPTRWDRGSERGRAGAEELADMHPFYLAAGGAVGFRTYRANGFRPLCGAERHRRHSGVIRLLAPGPRAVVRFVQYDAAGGPARPVVAAQRQQILGGLLVGDAVAGAGEGDVRAVLLLVDGEAGGVQTGSDPVDQLDEPGD